VSLHLQVVKRRRAIDVEEQEVFRKEAECV